MMLGLTRDPIDVTRLVAWVSHPAAGGTALFLGTVRRGADDGPVASIDYSAYEAMAGAEWSKILSEAASRWPAGRFAAEHRLGVVPVGEASIAVAAATPHRAEAFVACQWIVDEAKRRLPVWKKELFDDGHSSWREDGASAVHPHRA